MCIFPKPNTPDAPRLPPEPAQLKQPDKSQTGGAGAKVADQLRAGASTILTSGSGVTATAPTDKKVLLGQ